MPLTAMAHLGQRSCRLVVCSGQWLQGLPDRLPTSCPELPSVGAGGEALLCQQHRRVWQACDLKMCWQGQLLQSNAATMVLGLSGAAAPWTLVVDTCLPYLQWQAATSPAAVLHQVLPEAHPCSAPTGPAALGQGPPATAN